MNTRPIIIGLTGPAGAGKDTVRTVLEEEHGFYGLAFADPVRAMARALLEHVYCEHYASRRDLKETPPPVLGVSYREIAQTLGTEWGRRTIRESLWIDIAMSQARLALARGQRRIVISDVRFENEAKAIRAMGGRIWLVRRDGVQPVRAHVSEEYWMTADVDDVVSNDGSIDELRSLVALMVGVS